MTAAFTCIVAYVADGDTLRCAGGRRVRIAGIEANELSGGCHLRRCAPMPAGRARGYLAGLTLRRRLTCRPFGFSYRRVVASCSLDGVDIGCRLIAAGAAVDWHAYRRRYRMGPCDA